MHGQGLHFKWGDGAAFRCRTMAHCFEHDAIVRANGTFRYSRKVCLSLSDGWTWREDRMWFLGHM